MKVSADLLFILRLHVADLPCHFVAGFWFNMSDELVIEVFRKLSYQDLCNVACTCVKWNLLANDDFVRFLANVWYRWCTIMTNNTIPLSISLSYGKNST